MREHPAHTIIHTALQRLIPVASGFHGVLYRACDPIYANTKDLLTGEGSRRYGGRWNTPGEMATVYLAQSVEGAIAECLGLPSQYGFDPAKRLPLTLVAIDVDFDVVIDFTNANVRKSLGVTLGAIIRCDWRNENAAGHEALPQAIGRAAFRVGARGIIVPSAVKRTFKNLNVFPANAGGTSHMRIRGSEKLPPPAPPRV
ncbi:MAG TPA: RES domain-containing protein [Tepidisphaeraceae bacterium]|jgi:RES domain-containing protein|nr:RES domain-containing protein [Tepidisphaeraceae bacterium]